MAKSRNRSKASLNKYYYIFVCLFIAVSTFSVYWQIHNYDFVNFDDDEYVYNNPHVNNGITINNIIWAFTSFHSYNYHPLTWISHMIDCQLYGLNPARHHLTNLLFHIANALLLFFVFNKMTNSLWQSGFIAALFALHPLHIESVAWISERKDVLSMFFWILTLLSYISYSRRPSVYRYYGVLLFFIFGLLSKPMVVTLPFVLFLLDYWPLDRFGGQESIFCHISKPKSIFVCLVLEKIPLLILSGISSIVTFYAQKYGGIVKSLDIFPIKVRIANALVAYATYITKMIYPYKLAYLYPHPGMPLWWKLTGSCFLLFCISYFAIRSMKQYPYFIVGWLWFLGTLVPVIGLVQVGVQSMADRYSYVPLIGLFVIVAWGVPELITHWKRKNLWVTISTTIVLAILMIMTWKNIRYWENSITINEHALQVTSQNYIALDSLGITLFRQGHIDEAIHLYQQAIQIQPDNCYVHFNLGVALYMKGDIEEAIKQYLEALRIEPNYFKALTNLGAALYQQGHIDESINWYQQALRINPDYLEAHYNIGIAFDKLGKIEEAIQHYLQAVRIDPNFVSAQYFLAIDLYKQGRINESIDHYLQVLRIKPDSAEAYNNLGAALYSQGHIEKAIAHYQQALRIKPDYSEAYNNMGTAFFGKGDINGAIACFKKALQIKPDYINAKNNLNSVLMTQQ
jgi:protein O-mannosyl-transferase